MKKFLLNLIGWSEVQWEWKKRRWQERGVFNSLSSSFHSDHPALTTTLVLLGISYLILIIGGGGNPLEAAGVSAFTQAQYGFAIPSFITEHGESWRLITAIFVHYSLLHILFNGVALYQVGHYIEQEYGSARFFLVFLVTGLVGNILQFMFMSGNASLGGASGGVFGLIGFCGLHAHLTRNLYLRSVMLRWALYSFLFGLFMGAANLAHFGGFASGAALAILIPVYRMSRRIEVSLFRGIALAAWIIALGTGYKAVEFWRGSTAWETCENLLQEKSWEEAVKPCKAAKELLPSYPEPREDWEDLQKILSKLRPVINS